jgi:hypothetical protein
MSESIVAAIGIVLNFSQKIDQIEGGEFWQIS